MKLDQRRSAGFEHSGRLVFEKRLVRGHLPGLPRLIDSSEHLETLPADPAEFVVIPHTNKGPARAGVLQIGIVQIAAINGAVISHIGWNVKIADLFAMFV